MKAAAFALAALLCGGAWAQDSGAVCRTFCDTDAKQCRDRTAHPDAWAAAGALLFIHGTPSASPDGHEQARIDADRARSDHEHECGDARQACRQKCAAPAAPAAVTPPIAATPAPAAASAPN